MKCPWCEEDFSHYGIGHLVFHVRNCHTDQIFTEKYYHCPFCGLEMSHVCNMRYSSHVGECSAYLAAALSGCSLKVEP